MSQLTQIFSDIANSLRSKMGVTTTYKPADMAPAINSIDTVNQNAITIGGNITNAARLFVNGYYFNSPIIIKSNKITDMSGMFLDASYFNSPVSLPSSVPSNTNMQSMFLNATNFNQQINIPDGVNNITAMFQGATNFNQPITIPYSVKNAVAAFSGATNFNSDITIQQGVVNTCTMLTRTGFNRNITIPNSVNCIIAMLSSANNFGGSLLFPYGVNASINTAYLFQSCNNSLRKNIICKTSDVNKFTATNTESVVGAPITWTFSGNEAYNTAYNVYIQGVLQ